jgi:hypothetical protein
MDRPPRHAETLCREVEAPRRQPSGLGVMLLASTAMFFAVAGSAFILRSQMPPAPMPATIVTVDTIGPASDEIAPDTTCQVRSPVAADGSQVIEFRVCADE